MCLVRRERDLPHLPILFGYLQLAVDVGHGAVAVLAAVKEGDCVVVGVSLDCRELEQQVIYVYALQD